MKVIQCSDCIPPRTYPYKEGWTKPELCPYFDGKDVVKGDFKVKEITEEELLEIFK